MKTTFTETIQRYFARRQKETIINGVVKQLKLSFEKQAHELSKKLYENYSVDIILKDNPDGTLTAMTVVHTNTPSTGESDSTSQSTNGGKNE